MNTDEIKAFYSQLRFPGPYTWNDLLFYEEHGVCNIYLKEVDAALTDGIDVLDVGCGTGLVSNLFAMRHPTSKFTSIDFSDSIDYAAQFSAAHGINNVNWIKKDFLEFKTTKKYDVIVCCGVLHHIPQYELALAKMKSMLKPGGALLLAVYNRYGKILKNLVNVNYHSHILYQDQENNPFELSFTNKQVLTMCNDLTFEKVVPSIANKFVNSLALFNSENGGLALYVFKN